MTPDIPNIEDTMMELGDDGYAHPERPSWWWHIHHEILCEPLTEPLQNRLDYIAAKKPERERATRLRLIAPVTCELPKGLDKARVVFDRARAVYFKAQAVHDKAQAVYFKAQAVYFKAQAVYFKAQAVHDKAQAVYDKAWAVYDKAWVEAQPQLEALHATNCPAAIEGTCPWNGRTIFPKETA